MVLKKIFPVIIVLSISFFASIQPLFAGDAYTAVSSFFAEYDKQMEDIVKTAQRVTSLRKIENMLKYKIDKMDGISYLLRTNSKGKIIAKVTPDGIQSRENRFVGKQLWYKVMSTTNKPYYGFLKNNSSYFLFWNKPIHLKRKNKTIFGGSITVKINLRECFTNIALDEKIDFKVKIGTKVIFSNLRSNESELMRKPLAIKGLPVLDLYYMPKNPSVASKIEKHAVTNRVASTNKVAAPEYITSVKSIDAIVMIIAKVILFLSIIGLISSIVMLIKYYINKKYEEISDNIDRNQNCSVRIGRYHEKSLYMG